MFLLVYFQYFYLLELFVFACLLILSGLKVKNYLKNILIIEHIKMDRNSLEIKGKTNYDSDNICYIDDFNVNSLKIAKKESRIGANIYYTRCALNLDDDTIIPLYFIIDRLIGYIEEIEGSSDKYLVVVSSMRNKNIISVLDMVWTSIKDKINPGIKIKDYDKFRFNSYIDLPLNMIIEFRSLLINISCVIEKDNEYYPEIYLDECSYVKDNPCPDTTLFSENIFPTKDFFSLKIKYKMNKVKELRIDSTSWATPAKLVNLLDFEPEKISIETENNANNNIKVHNTRYKNGGFYQ